MNFFKNISHFSLHPWGIILLLFLLVNCAGAQSTLHCDQDTIPPFCSIQGFTLTGNTQTGGSPIFFPKVAYDNCSGVINVEYFLVNEGRSISEGDKLDCGNHLIQGIFMDANENLTSCEFVVKVNCNVEIHPALFPYQQNDASIAHSEKIIEEHNISLTDFELGSLSIIWESGKRGPGTVSKGTRDPGGTSYGIYQLSHKHGYLDDFFNHEGADFKSFFSNLKPGTDVFNKIWQVLGERNPTGFRKAQHAYIKRTHYRKYADRVYKQIGLKIDDYSNVLKDVLWSTAVQHGPFNNIFKYALQYEDLTRLSEKEIIQKVYAERGRMEGNQLANFPRVSKSWRKSLSQRFKSEEMVALSRLDAYYDDYVFNATGLIAKNVNVKAPHKEEKPPISTDITENVDGYAQLTSTQNSSNLSEQSKVGSQNSDANDDNSNTIVTNGSDSNIGSTLKEVIPNAEIPQSTIEQKENSHGVQSISSASDYTIKPVIMDVAAELSYNPPTEQVNIETLSSPSATSADFSTYRILFVILDDADASFPELEDLGIIIRDKLKHVDQTRYLIGEFDSIELAQNVLDQVSSRGFRAAVITQYTGAQFAGVVN